MYIRDHSLFLRGRGWPGGNRGWAIWKNMVKTGAIRKNDDILRGVIKILKLLRVQRNLKLLSPTIYRLQILNFPAQRLVEIATSKFDKLLSKAVFLLEKYYIELVSISRVFISIGLIRYYIKGIGSQPTIGYIFYLKKEVCLGGGGALKKMGIKHHAKISRGYTKFHQPTPSQKN
jgi:hypothetical protein